MTYRGVGSRCFGLCLHIFVYYNWSEHRSTVCLIEDHGDPRRSLKALGSIAIGTLLNRQVLLEERCHNVAKTGVDSGGLQETGGDDRMAGT